MVPSIAIGDIYIYVCVCVSELMALSTSSQTPHTSQHETYEYTEILVSIFDHIACLYTCMYSGCPFLIDQVLTI